MEYWKELLSARGTAALGMIGLILGCCLAVLEGPVPPWSIPGLVLGIGMMVVVLRSGAIRHAG